MHAQVHQDAQELIYNVLPPPKYHDEDRDQLAPVADQQRTGTNGINIKRIGAVILIT